MNLPDISQLSPKEMEQLRAVILEELRNRRAALFDPQDLLDQAMEKGFGPSGDPVAPFDLGGGIVGIAGVVRDTSATKHRCHLYTIRVDAEWEGERWSWDESSPTYLTSETVKIAGVRRSVSLHSLPDGAIIVQHSMKHDGHVHERLTVKSYQVVQKYTEDGEIASTQIVSLATTPRRLPLPPDTEY